MEHEVQLRWEPYLRLARKRRITTSEFCIACDSRQIYKEHPLFIASLCYGCSEAHKIWGMKCNLDGSRHGWQQGLGPQDLWTEMNRTFTWETLPGISHSKD